METFAVTNVESLSGSKVMTVETKTTEVFVRTGMEGDRKLVDVRRYHYVETLAALGEWGDGISLTVEEYEALKADMPRIDQILAELRAPERFRGSRATGM